MKKVLSIALVLLLSLASCTTQDNEETNRLKDDITELEIQISSLEERNTELKNVNDELKEKINSSNESTDVNKLNKEINDYKKNIDEQKEKISYLESMNDKLKREKTEILKGFDSYVGLITLNGFDPTWNIQFKWPYLYIISKDSGENEQHLIRLGNNYNFDGLYTAPISLDFRVSPDNKTIAILTTWEVVESPMLLFINSKGQELKRFGVSDFDPENLSSMYLGQWEDNNTFIVSMNPKPSYKINIKTWEKTEYKY